MESYSSSYSSSNNNSAYIIQNPEKAKVQKHAYRLQSHNTLLHSVRKTHAKPMKKPPVAPAMPPTPAKVYKVDPLNFRDLVQQLTGAPEFKPQQPHHHHHQQLLQSVEGDDTTSLDVVASHKIQDISSRNIAAASPPMHTNWYMDLQSELFGVKTEESATDGAMNMLDMNLSSPSSYSSWSNFFSLLSPGTMTSLEQGKVI